MTNSPSVAGNDPSLLREHDLLAGADIQPDAFGIRRYSGPHELTPSDTVTWQLYSQWLAEEDRIGNYQGPLTNEEINASLALTQDLARLILRAPVVSADDGMIKFLALCYLSSAIA